MSLDVFMACVQGYSDRLIDQQQLAVYTGFWSGYYASPGKRKKPLKSVIEMIDKTRQQEKVKKAPELDIETFLKREERRKRAGGEG